MRRVTFAVAVTVAILVLLFSYPTSTNQTQAVSVAGSSGAHVVTSATGTSPSAAGSPPPDPATPRLTPSPSATHRPSSSATAPTGTATQAPAVVDGAAAMTRYGPVQVEVTIQGNKITDVKALQYPTRDPRDREINTQAIPILRNQVISAQSAQIDGVSGATYTTEGYVTSLQSALDAAHFG
jgi:uncharacterized protein with FMN-binding domain